MKVEQITKPSDISMERNILSDEYGVVNGTSSLMPLSLHRRLMLQSRKNSRAV